MKKVSKIIYDLDKNLYERASFLEIIEFILNHPMVSDDLQEQLIEDIEDFIG